MDAVPQNKISRPKAFVNFSRPRSFTKIMDVREINPEINRPKKMAIPIKSAYEVHHGTQEMTTPEKKRQQLYMTSEFILGRSDRIPVVIRPKRHVFRLVISTIIKIF